jgi:hypothetical protein
MTVQDKIEALKQEFLEKLAELEKEAAEEYSTSEDILAKYVERFDGNNRSYYLDDNSEVDWTCISYVYLEDARNPYQLYPTADLARLAYAHKRYNDMLLAFKYCYDNNYCPDWESVDILYSVGFNHKERKYEAITLLHDTSSSVIFSTKEIAQKCADWLNAYPEFAPKRLYHECDSLIPNEGVDPSRGDSES